MNDDTAAPMLVSQLFDETARYRVPLYQRSYAWGADEIKALFTDIGDMRRHSPTARYYIGTLVAHRSLAAADGYPTYDVVDGQQRLTTLFLTLANPVLRDRFRSQIKLPVVTPSMLSYEGRPRSSGDLARLVRMNEGKELQSLDDDGIRAASELIGALVERQDITEEDVSYLLHSVEIVRTLLPVNTDLNHYFEIMNTRGEQLEKHEIVKAHLMECLDDAGDRRVFAAVWDVCSDLAKHVQAATPKSSRAILFGSTWNELQDLDFAEVGKTLALSETAEEKRGILHLLSTTVTTDIAATTDDDDETPRYGAIIDFPNFLLLVLRLHVTAQQGDEVEARVALDDKRLVEQFKREFGPGSAALVKRFAEELLRARFLFDNFVIRTDSVRDTTQDDSNWVIHRPHRTGEGKAAKVSPIAAFDKPADQDRVLMLQAMYQVTDSRRSYKTFLYQILHNLRAQWTKDGSVSPEKLIRHMDEMAAARVSEDGGASLDSGTAVSHFVFNYLDYLLWKAYIVDMEAEPPGVRATDFRFRYRTSVEHFYPVAPERDALELETVNQFGNLCIMGRDENSRRSNLMPLAKINQYVSSDQSLKFQLMASMATTKGAWRPAQMKEHGDDMIERLRANQG